jgi:flavin reductase (DIM6/NTAB) family NADH-FMN oxidoreductase RutF
MPNGAELPERRDPCQASAFADAPCSTADCRIFILHRGDWTMRIAAKELETEASYRLITGIVVPRPIAWVTTLSAKGGVNLAPFSMFTSVSPKPPLMAISVGRNAGVYKDTARNILAREEYVIHIADFSHLEALHASSTEYPSDVSEVEKIGLATAASDEIAVPRLRDAPVAMECRFRNCIEFGFTKSRLIIGEVVMFHFRDGLVQNGKIATADLDPIARLAGPTYARLGEVLTLAPAHQTRKD